MYIIGIFCSTSGVLDTFFDNMEELLSKYTPPNRKQLTLLCGDLNINSMNNTPEKSKLLDIVESNGLVQANFKPTRNF
jgi:hypothetical protein